MVVAFHTAGTRAKTTDIPKLINMSASQPPATHPTDIVTFGTGCFWCTEAIFQELKGIVSVTSGYMGGHGENPNYEEVWSGTTGHAECLQLAYDPAVISYDELLQVFFESHDPTQLNRQGNDIGTQYRSAIFYHTEEQKQKEEHYKADLAKARADPNPIVTT